MEPAVRRGAGSAGICCDIAEVLSCAIRPEPEGFRPVAEDRTHMTEAKNPPCPYCGERQTYDESTHVWPRKGRHAETHCRKCGERIIFGFQYGSGSLAEIGHAEPRYSWSKTL